MEWTGLKFSPDGKSILISTNGSGTISQLLLFISIKDLENLVGFFWLWIDWISGQEIMPYYAARDRIWPAEYPIIRKSRIPTELFEEEKKYQHDVPYHYRNN